MTETIDRTKTGLRGTMFYDETCNICTAGAMRLRSLLASKSIAVEPFEDGAAEAEMRVVWHDGREFGGADAVLFLARQFWIGAPIAAIAGLPGLKRLTGVGYRFIAENRHCANGACALNPEPRKVWPDWLFLATLVCVMAVLGLIFPVPAWVWMWMLAGALWAGFKLMTFRAEGGWRAVNPAFFGWIGTDAAAFRYDRAPAAEQPRILAPLAFIVAGLTLALAILPGVSYTLAIGWLGVTAMLCLFHFGAFAILAEIWRKLGFPVEPIMRAPWAAKSLADFWGPRWNRAFSGWARVCVFRPLVRRLGIVRGTLAGFFASGIAHELVISLPARGGFGLPTAYFLLQAAGLLAQRRFPALRGRFATLTMVLLPAPILFHPTFIERVFAPMMDALLALTHP